MATGSVKKGFVTKVSAVTPKCPAKHVETSSWRLLAPASHGNKAATISLVEIRPGGKAEPDVHEASEQMFYIISGRVKAHVSGEDFDVEPNSLLFVPEGALHSMEVVGEEVLRMVVVTAPPR